jgi:hypothetical protein
MELEMKNPTTDLTIRMPVLAMVVEVAKVAIVAAVTVVENLTMEEEKAVMAVGVNLAMAEKKPSTVVEKGMGGEKVTDAKADMVTNMSMRLVLDEEGMDVVDTERKGMGVVDTQGKDTDEGDVGVVVVVVATEGEMKKRMARKNMVLVTVVVLLHNVRIFSLLHIHPILPH